MRIVKDYQLAGLEDIQNYMVPHEYNQIPLLNIAERWKERDFQGYNEDQIKTVMIQF